MQLIHLARQLGRAVDPRARDEALVLEDAEHGGRRGLQVPERGGERGRVHARGVRGGEDRDVPCPDGGEVGLCGTGVSGRGWDGMCNRWKGGRGEEGEKGRRGEGEKGGKGTYCEGLLVLGRDDEPDVPSRPNARPDRFAYL